MFIGQKVFVNLKDVVLVLTYSERRKSKLPKSKRMGIWNSDGWAFGTTPQLSEIQTSHPYHNATLKCYFLSTSPPPSPFGGLTQLYCLKPKLFVL